MKLGMVGLGRMGGNMTARLQRSGHEVVAYDPSPDAVSKATETGASGASSLEDLVAQLETPTSAPRVVWLMIPAGEITERTIATLAGLLSIAHGEAVARYGIRFLDCGTSGGIWGLANGYCLMVGGDADAVAIVEPAFRALAPEDGYAHVGRSGAGHFTKMVHNGIEYGLLAAYGEGFEILNGSDFDLDLLEIAGIWRYGSVVRSWLLELLHDAMESDPGLKKIRGYVDDSGEGRWTIEAAMEENVPAPITSIALFNRFASRQEESFSAKVIAALRNEFGGHAVKEES